MTKASGAGAAAAGVGGAVAVPSIIGNFAAMIAAKVPYVSGGASKLGADCSGAINYVFLKAGYSVGGFTGQGHGPTTYGMVGMGENEPISGSDELDNLDPGDILLFNEPGEGANAHVALYVGNGMMDDEPEPGMTAHQIPVTLQYLDDVQRFIDPATGAPLGSGITGSYNGTDTSGGLAAPADVPTQTVGIISDTLGNFKTAGGYIVAVGAGVALIGLGIYKTVAPPGTASKVKGDAKTGAELAAVA